MTKNLIAHAYDKKGRKVSASADVIAAKIKAGELSSSAPSSQKAATAAKSSD